MIYVSISFNFVTLPSRFGSLFTHLSSDLCVAFYFDIDVFSFKCMLFELREEVERGSGRKFAVNFREFEKRQVHLN